MDDERDWPSGHPRDGAAAARFRRWRALHPSAPTAGYDDAEWRRREEDARGKGLHAPPDTPAEWRRRQDDGYLTPEDRAAVGIGGVPELTWKRVARWSLAPLGFVFLLLAWMEHAEGEPFFGWPMGLVGAAVLMFGLAMKYERRSTPRG